MPTTDNATKKSRTERSLGARVVRAQSFATAIAAFEEAYQPSLPSFPSMRSRRC